MIPPEHRSIPYPHQRLEGRVAVQGTQVGHRVERPIARPQAPALAGGERRRRKRDCTIAVAGRHALALREQEAAQRSRLRIVPVRDHLLVRQTIEGGNEALPLPARLEPLQHVAELGRPTQRAECSHLVEPRDVIVGDAPAPLTRFLERA